MKQQTTLTIDDDLFIQAAKLVAVQDKNQLVEIALRELIQNRQLARSPDIRELVGKVEIAPDYDYKKLRCDGDNTSFPRTRESTSTGS